MEKIKNQIINHLVIKTNIFAYNYQSAINNIKEAIRFLFLDKKMFLSKLKIILIWLQIQVLVKQAWKILDEKSCN